MAISMNFWFEMADFCLINFKIGLCIGVNVGGGQGKLGVRISNCLARVTINWHRIGQMPLWCVIIGWV